MPHQRPKFLAKGDAGHLECLAFITFVAGFNFDLVHQRWPKIVRAFNRFSVEKVARYGERDVKRLMADQFVIHNERKIRAVIENAREVQRFRKLHGTFKAYIKYAKPLGYEKNRKNFKKRFAFLGETSSHWFMWYCGFKE